MEGGWRTLYHEKLHNRYTSPNVITEINSRRMIWAGLLAHMQKMRNAYNILVGKSEGKRPLGRCRCRWEDVRIDLRQIGWEGVDWIHLAQDMDQWRAVVSTIMNFRVS